MIRGFKEFILKNQVLGLAIGVIIGTAVGKVISSLVADILMPVISLVLPGGAWREAKVVLARATGPDGKEVINSLNLGTFLGSVIDFLAIAFCVYIIAKIVLGKEPAAG